jgi:hypothetical protein
MMARTHVIVSDEVMQAIDARVGQRGRSRFIEEAAREKLQRLGLEESLQATSGMRGDSVRSEWADRRSSRDWVQSTRRSESERDAG